MAARRVAVIGAATSAGSHHAGQERAPAALRSAGFVTRLADTGLDVTDLGDVAGATFTPDEMGATARGLAQERWSVAFIEGGKDKLPALVQDVRERVAGLSE